MKASLLILALSAIIGSAYCQTAASKTSSYTYQIISAEGNTYGYDIMLNQKIKVHQPNVPGLTGNKGFKNQQAATRIAKLVIKKMENGEMPPTITQEEMKQLNAL